MKNLLLKNFGFDVTLVVSFFSIWHFFYHGEDNVAEYLTRRQNRDTLRANAGKVALLVLFFYLIL